MPDLLDWDENYNSGVFKVADYESSLEFSKSNMADRNVKNYLIPMKISTQESLESLNVD